MGLISTCTGGACRSPRSAALTRDEAALDGDAQDFYATWARKEAVLKAMEIGAIMRDFLRSILRINK